MSQSGWSLSIRVQKALLTSTCHTTPLSLREWFLFDVYTVVKKTTITKTNRNWSNVVCTLIDNDIRHH